MVIVTVLAGGDNEVINVVSKLALSSHSNE
jgi:hypothetical protein